MRVRDGSGNAGFNTLTGEYEELISAGVADPAIICRSALQNAASIGSPILTYEAVVAPPPEGGGAAAVSRAGHNMDFI